MNTVFRHALHHVMILAVSLSCLVTQAPAGLSADQARGMDRYPHAPAALDRQLNQLDSNLTAFNNKNNGNLFKNSTVFAPVLPDGHACSRSVSRDVPSLSVVSLRTCLWYIPLLPIPPPAL